MKAVIVVLILGLTSIFVSSSRADVVEYGDFAGANVNFIAVSEASDAIGPGTDQVADLFGTPTVSGDTLVFTPEQFDTLQQGTGTNTVDSQLALLLEAQAGFEIVEVIFTEFGNYSISTPFPTSGGVGAVNVVG